MRTKSYLTAACICLMLFFFSMWQISPVVVGADDFLGLASHLGVVYWLGLAGVTACAVKASLDSKLARGTVFVAILLVLGLFLFGPRVFAEANPAPGAAYWVGAGYKDAMSHLPVDLTSARALDNYSAWPGFHFVTAGLLSVTGVGYETLARYMPLFWLLSSALIVFATGSRLGLSDIDSFLASVMTIASLWVLQNYYGPQMLAFIQYLLLFMVIVTYRATPTAFLLVVVTFLALVITHGLTSVAVVLAAAFVSLYARRSTSALVLVAVFLGWVAFLSPISLDKGVTTFRDQLINMDLLSFMQTSGYQSAPTMAGQIGKFSRFLYPAVYALLAGGALVMYVRKKIDNERRGRIALCAAWAVGILALLVVGTGWKSEVDWRVYIFLAPVVAAVAVMALSGKATVMMSAVAVVFIALHIPANYHTEALHQTVTSELRGAEFFAARVTVEETTYITYGYEAHRYIQFYDPAKLTYPWRRVTLEYLAKDKVDAATAVAMEQCGYIISAERTHNALMYTYGHDPELEWIEANPPDLVYTNGHYQIYRR